jgi:hypothetical protein
VVVVACVAVVVGASVVVVVGRVVLVVVVGPPSVVVGAEDDASVVATAESEAAVDDDWVAPASLPPVVASELAASVGSGSGVDPDPDTVSDPRSDPRSDPELVPEGPDGRAVVGAPGSLEPTCPALAESDATSLSNASCSLKNTNTDAPTSAKTPITCATRRPVRPSSRRFSSIPPPPLYYCGSRHLRGKRIAGNRRIVRARRHSPSR